MTIHRMAYPVLSLTLLAGTAFAADTPQAAPSSPERTEAIARRGAQVMPFDLDRTRHVFSKTASGGQQQVVADDARDEAQILLVREHLAKIAAEFREGLFNDPARIHGDDMPGLRELRSARPGQLRIQVRELPLGAVVEYRSDNPEVVAALHRWFDAQLADHGRHARPGHEHSQHHGH